MERAVVDRFMAKVIERSTGCWEWTAFRNPKGYGRFRTSATTVALAHRLSYELHVGPIPEGLVLDHLCRNRACVNPYHLEPVSQWVNTMRGDTFGAKNAAKTHCDKGHEFTPGNTYARTGRTGLPGRQCRQCALDRSKERRRNAHASKRLGSLHSVGRAAASG